MISRRTFLVGLWASAGALTVPEILIPNRTFFLPPVGGWKQWQYENISYALGYKVTRAELADNLYSVLRPGVQQYWDEYFETKTIALKEIYA